MKKARSFQRSFKLFYILTILSALPLCAQVSIQVNLPRVLKSNSSYDFELRINSNADSSIIGYEMALPAGMSLKPKTRNLTFITHKQTARLFIPELRQNKDTSLFFTLVSGARGTYQIQQKLIKKDDTASTDYAVQDFVVSVIDSVKADYVGGGFTLLNLKQSSGAGNNTAQFAGNDTMRLQQLQKYLDSKQIGKVGLKELDKAWEYYEDANIVLGQAEHISDDDMREKIITYALAARKKAEADMETANNIINASKEMEMSAKSRSSSKSAKSADMLPADGTIYTIQLGAFKHAPDVKTFSGLGKIYMVREDGWHKVLLGSFRTREEAAGKLDSIKNRGYDAILATYKNGQRQY